MTIKSQYPLSGISLTLSIIALLVTVSIFVLPYLIMRLFLDAPLQHQESYTFMVIFRMLAGKEIYSYPELGINTFGEIYNPLYYWYVFSIIGGNNDWVTIRMASVLPLLFPFLLFIFLNKFYFRYFITLVWFCFVLISIGMGAWLDLARLDALFLSVTLCSMLLLIQIKKSNWFFIVLTGISIGVAASIKQSGILILVIPLVMSLVDKRFLNIFFVALFFSFLLYFIYFFSYGENYVSWAFQFPSQHMFSISSAMEKFNIFFKQQYYFLVFLLIITIYWIKNKITSKEDRLIILAYIIVLFLICFISSGKSGGSPTSFSLFGIISTFAISYFLGEQIKSGNYIKVSFIIFTIVASFLYNIFSYNLIHQYKPDENSENKLTRLVDFVSNINGPVWMFAHPSINILANKNDYTPLQTILAHPDSQSRELTYPVEFGKKIRDAIADNYFSLIITSTEVATEGGGIDRLLTKHYTFCGLLPHELRLSRMRHRMFVPDMLWVPKNSSCPETNKY